jgi:hypothetical protein
MGPPEDLAEPHVSGAKPSGIDHATLIAASDTAVNA